MNAMKKIAALSVCALSLAVAGTASAQQGTSGTSVDSAHAHKRTGVHHRTTSQAALQAQAKISADSARAIAMAEVPGGTIQSSELEREHGKLIYSYDVKVDGKPGIEEVNVDAKTGKLIAHEHETPKAEKREAAQEKKAAAKKP